MDASEQMNKLFKKHYFVYSQPDDVYWLVSMNREKVVGFTASSIEDVKNKASALTFLFDDDFNITGVII